MVNVVLRLRVGMVVAVLGAAVLGGCAGSGMQPNGESGKVIGEGPVMGTEPIGGGIYAGLGSYVPLKGDALKKAMTERGAVLAMIHVEPASQPATQASTQTAEDNGPPPLAVKYYLHGREKFLNGENTEAMELLEKSLALDPNAFTVLRLMGKVCFASSQLSRGSLYLQKARAIEPDDVEVNYILGRHWLEKKDYDRAIFYLMAADNSPGRSDTSVETPSVMFYLARSLGADGFNKAAAAEYEAFLTQIELPVPGYRYDRDLNYLMDERWATELSIAENMVQIGDYAGAVGHYETAATDEPRDAFVVSRWVNALVHVGKMDDGRKAALDFVAGAKGSDESIKLLIWTYKSSGKEGQILSDLQTALGGTDEATTAVTVAMTQEMLGQREQSFATLADFSQKHADNLDVLKRTLERVKTAAEFKRGLMLAGEAIHAVPEKREDVLDLVRPLAATAAAKSYFADPTYRNGERTAEGAYVEAIALQIQNGTPEEVETMFKGVLVSNEFFAGREAYVEFLLKQEKFKQASEIIQGAIDKNEGGPRAWELLVQSEAAQHRHSHALAIAQEAEKKYPDSAELQLQEADVYILRGQDTEGQDVLENLLEKHPKFEKGYETLINSLFGDMRDGGKDGQAAMTKMVAALSKMSKELPASRFGQVATATLYAQGGRLEEAEAILAAMLPEDPNDPDVLLPLAEIRQIEGHTEEAVATLAESLKRKSQATVAEALAGIYQKQGKADEALGLVTRLAKENPEVEGFVYLQASTMFGRGAAKGDDAADAKQREAAVELMQAAVKKFPRSQEGALALASMLVKLQRFDDAEKVLIDFMARAGETAERLYELSHLYADAGDLKKAETTLQRVLSMMPDHTGANNDLGYFWTDEGAHLSEAEGMIRKAVDNEPNNAAYLDSLGWLLYKEGKPGEAVGYLSKAVGLPAGDQPDVVQHLGDALYRSGKKPEAMERWLEAQTMLSGDNGVMTDEKKKLKAYLEKVIGEDKDGQTVEVTPMAKRDGRESAEK